jgi:hypothetical protein
VQTSSQILRMISGSRFRSPFVLLPNWASPIFLPGASARPTNWPRPPERMQIAHINGVLFDLPFGIAAARAGAGGPLPRSGFVTGSFFDSVPPADTYIPNKVIHDWDDERAAAVLRNFLKAMAGNDWILLAETHAGRTTRTSV